MGLSAQGISVTSFKPLPNDLTANLAGTQVKDQNGEVAARIKVAFLLHRVQDMVHHALLVLVEPETLQHVGIALKEFSGGEPHGESCRTRAVFRQVHHGVQATMERAAVPIVVPAEVLSLRAGG